MLRWNWIHSARADLTWYIGSAIAGWLHVVVVLIFGHGLGDPLRDPFFVVHVGEIQVAT